MKRIIKNPVMMYILGIITCTLTTVLASSLLAGDITYKPKDKSWGVTNVQAAIDSLKLAKTSDNYSADERVVGTWIDGKPIYQKTFSINGCALLQDSTWYDTEVDGTNYSNIIYSWGMAKDTNTSVPSSFPLMSMLRSTDKHLLIMETRSQTDMRICNFTVQYTKTTD